MSAEHPNHGKLEEMFDLMMEGQRPGDPDYHNNMGSRYRARGELDNAIREYREAIRLRPDDAMFHCNLGITCTQKGEYQEALCAYEHALRLRPSDYHAHFSLGNLLRKLERNEDAIVAYQRAIEREPERVEAHCNLAACYWDARRWQDAASHYGRALTLEPDMPLAALAHYRIGWHFLRQRSLEKAEAHLLEALRREPDEFMTNYTLAGLYFHRDAGEPPQRELMLKAAHYARKAVELDPSDVDAKGLLLRASAELERTKPLE